MLIIGCCVVCGVAAWIGELFPIILLEPRKGDPSGDEHSPSCYKKIVKSRIAHIPVQQIDAEDKIIAHISLIKILTFSHKPKIIIMNSTNFNLQVLITFLVPFHYLR